MIKVFTTTYFQYDGILFLDIDGVLNHEKFFSTTKEKRIINPLEINLREAYIDPENLAILNKLLIESKLAIVISSTWRLWDMTKTALFDVGIDTYKERLIGYTPSEPVGPRGRQIKAWLKMWHYIGPYVTLDDDNDMEDIPLENIVWVKHGHTTGGLKESHAKEVLYKMQGQIKQLPS